ncbi:MAG TPA: hypothetical protein VNR87_05080 [Flavisolibacter sp.]|nr:hypothetical protein [Flavisolibacter sp.]
MINVSELRLGNYILQKYGGRIVTVKCSYQHFELISREGTRDLYPVVLKAGLLEDCGFSENPDYPLLPGAREFLLVLPIPGSNKNELRAYIKNNNECFGRATLNGLPASTNFYHLHQLQNIYFALTGKEMMITITDVK